MDIHTVFSFLASKAHNAPTVPEQLCKISSATPQWWRGQKGNKMLSEQRGRDDLVLQAEVQVQPAWLKNVKLSLIAGRPVAWIPEGRTAVCLGRGDRWTKPSRTRISQLFQDQLEYIFCLIEMPAQTKRESKCIWIKARVTNPKCSIFFG